MSIFQQSDYYKHPKTKSNPFSILILINKNFTNKKDPPYLARSLCFIFLIKIINFLFINPNNIEIRIFHKYLIVADNYDQFPLPIEIHN